ncbi:MAG: SsrA-binding protein SmpB [Candidatus Saccharimonadales bacterium]
MKKKSSSPAIVNRRARYDYELLEDLITGIVLTGPETRAARDGHVQLKGSYVTIRDDELWLNNASFSVKINEKGGGHRSVDTTARKLLAHRKQIDQLAAKKKQGMSIVPTKLLTEGHKIKLIIALGKGKKNYDKRETIKRREQDRESRRR